MKRPTNTKITKNPTPVERIKFIGRKAQAELKTIARKADTTALHKRRT